MQLSRRMSIPVLTVSQMREWEKATWATGQSEAEVIRRVGLALAQHALRLTRPGDLILILAGKGNNGADGRAARAHLADRRVDLLEIKDPAADVSRLEALLSLQPGLIIDGLFGIGLNRPLSPPWINLIERVNSASRRVLAVDVPSGLNAETGATEGAAIRAAVTLTVGAPKIGMVRSAASNYVGRLEVTGDVGLIPCPCSSELLWTIAEDFSIFPPGRPVATHKGTYGHAAIVAGSLGYHGASVLSARGAQRAQPGLITLYTMPSVYTPVAAQSQAVMVSPWKPGLDFAEKYSALLVGPGLAGDRLPAKLRTGVAQLWRDLPIPMIVDASALSWLPRASRSAKYLRLITPHPGEAARLLKKTSKEVQEDRVGSLRALSKAFGGTWVLLKGHESLVGHADGPIHVNCTGNPFLAQGGSGDLLSGYLVGLLAQPALQADPGLTIRYAVWAHGAAADRLQQARCGWTVEELADELGKQG